MKANLDNHKGLSEELVKSWHPLKNGNLSPFDFSPMSNKKIWWQCEKGHEWQAIIANRSGKNNTGCPFCAGKKVAPDRNLAINFPELAVQWNYERNSGKRPEEFSPKSGKKVWWRCPKGHEWEAVMANRSNGNGCPVCAGRKSKA